MITLQEITSMLDYRKMPDYIKKNRNNNMTNGMIYLAIAAFLGLIYSIITIFVNILFSGVNTNATNVTMLNLFGLDAPGLLLLLIFTSILGFFMTLIGIAVTHYVAKMFGGKAEMGEYFYAGGKYLFVVQIINLIIGILSVVPCVNCVVAILSIIFFVYSVYLFVVLVSSLYSIGKLVAFVSIAVGFLTNCILAFVIESIIGILTGLPLGIKMIERMADFYGNLMRMY